MNNHDKYIDVVNKLLKDAVGNAESMAELAIVLHKGIAALIMNIKDEHQEEMLTEVEPMVRSYIEEIKRHHTTAVFKA